MEHVMEYEVPESPKSAEQPIDIFNLHIEQKIILLNAFNKLLKFKIGNKVTTHNAAACWIDDTFHEWVLNLMNSVLSGKSSYSGFTDEEIIALKALANNIKQRTNQPQPIKAPVLVSQAAPLKDSVDVNKHVREQEVFLRKLSEMDKLYNP